MVRGHKRKLNEAILLAGRDEKINSLKRDTRKTEALWLITSNSNSVNSVDFDTRVVKPGVFAPMAVVLEEKTELTCETLLGPPLHGDQWTRAKLPTALDGLEKRYEDTAFAGAIQEDETSDGKK